VKQYQKALQLHQEGKWQEADQAYLSLLGTEIIQDRVSKKVPPSRSGVLTQIDGTIVDSPQCRLQRLVLRNYAQFIMDVLPSRRPDTVDQMLPVAMRSFAEVQCRVPRRLT
jgi:hypothetical protein